jgi:RHS repeat-associated protein
MHSLVLVTWLLFNFSWLYSYTPPTLSKQPICVIAENAPNAFVNDTVSVITGSFYLKLHHMNVPGHIPLDFIQYYNSHSKYTPWLGTGMSLNYSFSMQGLESVADKHEKYSSQLVSLPGGSIISCLGKNTPNGTSYYFLDPKVVYEGITNCSSGQISARTNLKNLRVKERVYYNASALWTCYLPDGSVRRYHRAFDKEDAMNVRTEVRPNKTRLYFSYYKYHENEGCIRKISAFAKHPMNWLAFKMEGKHHDRVVASNGNETHFHFFEKDDDYYIDEIESTEYPKYRFHYTHAGDYYCIDRVERPNGRFLELEYDHKGRVTAQKAPVGAGDERRTLYEFTYKPDHTIVVDAHKNKKIYTHKDSRITSIEEKIDDKRYRESAFYWGKRRGLSWAKLPKTKEAVFDANNSYRYSTYYEYDEKARLIKKTNPVGEVFRYEYDSNNNKTYEEQKGSGFSTTYEYDKVNRCTAILEHHQNEKIRTSFTYDLMGNKTSSTDRYGHTTTYKYDDCNRLSKIILPNKDTIHKEYDIFDNLVKETRPNNATTAYKYTIRNKPYLITYADGTKERSIYNRNGTLAHTWNQDGTRTSYKHDVLGRITETSVYDSSKKRLTTTKKHYNSVHLLSSTDPLGHITHYRYDGAGRKIEEWQKSSGNYSKTTFSYDALGRLSCIKNAYGLATYKEYDNLNRLTLEKQVDTTGFCTEWTYYEYDALGNCTLKRSGHTSEDAEVKQKFNSQGECIAFTDEYGNTTRTKYNHHFINNDKVEILQKIITDPLHNTTEKYYDILGRLTSTLKRNAKGSLLAVTDYFYNSNNKKIKQVEKVIANGVIERDYIITWKYDKLDRVVQLSEQPGSSDEKRTKYSYDACGRLSLLTKPDGTTLTHAYDPLGRLISLSSSDGTISYTYTYDLCNNPIAIHDAISGYTTKRAYDAWHHLIEDGLENHHSIKCAYDATGRLVSLIAPDRSSVEYRYKEAYLRDIKRYNTAKELLYTHHYNTFDLKGRPLEWEMIGSLGKVHLAWDKKGRNTKSTTPFFHHQIPAEGFDAVGNLKWYTFTDHQGAVEVKASYNDLYQLIHEEGVQTHTYALDSLHNRRLKNASEHQLDTLNKVLSDGATSFTYDKNGNLIQEKRGEEVITYAYDALDRLISVSDGTQYVYDSFNRRITRIHQQNTEYFLYFDMREIGTLEHGKIKEFRVLGLGKGAEIGASVALECGGKVFAPIHDFRGNIVCIVDTATGHLQESYRYTAFGECEVYSQGKPINPWRFASKRYDPETGFVYFGKRYYAPALGRWVTPDPLGIADGPNMYAYVHSNPLTNFDLYGLFAFEDEYDPVEAAWFCGFAGATLKGFVDIGSLAGLLWDGCEGYELFSRTGHEAIDAYHKGILKEMATLNGGTASLQNLERATEGGAFVRNVVDITRAAVGLIKQAVKGGQAIFRATKAEKDEVSSIIKGKNVNSSYQNDTKSLEVAREGSSNSKVKLNKHLASQQQMNEKGVLIAGSGASKPFRNANHAAAQYGGNASTWVKKSSSTFTAPDGTKFSTHWIEHVETGERREFKTKLLGAK